MAADRSVILAWISELASELVRDAIDLAAIGSRVDLAAGLSAEAFAGEALSLMNVVAESVLAPDDFDRFVIPSDVEEGQTRDAMSVLLAIGMCVAGPRLDWPSQPAARVARGRISDAGDVALTVASAMGGDGARLYGWLTDVISASVRAVSELAANAVPIVRVETALSLPSTVLAYQLYGDAARAGSIVDIARSATPMLMPAGFEALER